MPSHSHRVIFGNNKLHSPICLPKHGTVKIFLQNKTVLQTMNVPMLDHLRLLVDFAKAFDKVPHRRLLHKLVYYVISGSIHKWINLWLSGHFQQVVLDGQASDPVPVLSGLLQGSVLGLVSQLHK